MYYVCSENKGADQLGVYSTADQCPFFRILQKTGFLIVWLA